MRRAKGVVSALVALAAGLLIGQGCSVADQTGSADIPDGGAETGDDDATTAKPVCGDGVTAEPEQCDDANHVNGDGCDDDCTFSCDPADPNRGLTKCDKNPCRGALSCSAAHVCTYGTASPNGASCGDGKICNNGSCASAVCGDGFVTPPEECDDSNAKDGDGCDTTCTFSCVPNDPKRDCAPKDACAGQGTCNAGTHVCAAGTPLPNGTSCGAAGSGDVCKGGVCAAPSCGDGIVEAPEDCDFGAGNGVGTGCEANCKFSCSKTPESCVTVDLCAGTNACTTVTVSGATGQKCVTGAPPPDGTACGTGGTCSGGLCRMATCGNGTIETGEQCDFGAGNNGPGTGCELDCQFSCQTAPTDSCPGSDPCSASPQKCSPVTVAGHPGQKCAAQPVLAQCASCGGANICVGNVCKANQCGDTCVAGTETCDPPNGTTCSASCTTIVCGDGKREGLEQCDDGQSPPLNLDGCDSTCKFEQDHRANSVTLLYNPSTLCATNNALGSAIASVAQGQLQTSLSNGVKDGSTTIMLKFAGLMDLTGTNQPNVQVGGLGGKVVAGPGYDGTKDLEWWCTTDPTSIDGSRPGQFIW